MGSIRNRLALMFLAITLSAVAIIYFYVTPSLQANLRRQKLDTLAQAARSYSPPLQHTTVANVPKRVVDRDVRHASDVANTRVTLLGVTRGTLGVATYPIADSQTVGPIPDLGFTTATKAVRTGQLVTGSESGARGLVAEAAMPLFFGGTVARVVVYSTSLSDVQSNVALIRRRILVAGAFGLVIALLAGYLIARALSQRIKRLERTAGRVAARDFSARFPVDSPDELGQLARALEDMYSQLAELDTARKQFIATASHELRTPIFSLGGFLELIDDEELDEETRKQFVGQVRQQVDRLGRLAAGLLDLNRLEAGSLDLRPERTDLDMLARAVTDEFLPALAQHSSNLELRLSNGPIHTVCDPERVAQIMRILIDNAITHTPEGTNIVVTAARHDGSVRLVVRDSGPGIRPAVLARIFEPFFTSDEVQGSGLGLTIARELAERMNGRLEVESRPGRTTFTLEMR